jgi:hypothetical protein
VIALDPDEAGGLNERDIEAFPGVATRPSGAPGVLTCTATSEAPDAPPPPQAVARKQPIAAIQTRHGGTGDTPPTRSVMPLSNMRSPRTIVRQHDETSELAVRKFMAGLNETTLNVSKDVSDR